MFDFLNGHTSDGKQSVPWGRVLLILLVIGTMHLQAAAEEMLRPDASPARNPAAEQALVVTGTISNDKGEPLVGATVIIKGTSTGSVTDAQGRYSIQVPDGSSVLLFSFLGYQSQDVPVNGRSVIDVRLQEDLQQLEQIVVVGYASQKKVNVTGAVSTVDFDNDAITSRPLTNASVALAGLSPGLSVSQSKGVPGSDEASLKIRGTGSLNASQNPLVIIDGQPGDINTISPHDIANVSILKDAASAAIYGSRASNGVILVTTKSGANTDGKVTFNYNGNIGFSKPTKLNDWISNTADHLTVLRQIDLNSGKTSIATPELIAEWREKSKTDPLLYPNTDWWDAMLKPNMIHNHALSARGGNEKINFYSSFNYLNNDGLMPNTGYQRYTFRNTLNYQVTPWLKLGNTISAMFGDQDPGAGASDNVLRYLATTTPGMLPKHPDGRYGGAMTGEGGNNQLRVLENSVGERKTQQYTGKIFATVTLTKGLEVTGSYFLDKYNFDAWESLRRQDQVNFQTGAITLKNFPAVLTLSNSYTKRTRSVFDLYANYDKSFGDHNLKVLVGYNQEYYQDRYFNAQKKDLYSLDVPVFDAAPTVVSAGGNTVEYAMRSYFGRINYNYKEKYLFEANLRADGSSRFAPDERWGVFPSFSVGWRISEENFWDGLKNHIENLKLRASWGQLGNNGVGNYDWQNVYGAANYSFNGTIVQGMAPSAIANPYMTWETTDVANVGLDISFLKHFSLSLDFYDKLTHGILANIPIPFVNGGLTAPRMNSAEVRNRGIEFDLNYHQLFGEFSLSVGINGSYNRNRIESYKGDYYEPHGVGVWTEGQPIGKFYLRQIDHIVQDQAEIDRMLADGFSFSPSTPGPGDFLYKNTNGDKKINDDDRVLMGNPIPLFNFGINIGMNYKGFDFYTLMTGVAGVDKYVSGLFNHNTHTIGFLYPTRFLDQWTPENPSTTVPKVYTGNPINQQASEYNLYDASFFRFKTIQLGYTIPERWARKIHLDKLRLYVNLENFFTFTSFPGMDPEMSGSAYNGDLNYPLLKTVSVGLNINF